MTWIHCAVLSILLVGCGGLRRDDCPDNALCAPPRGDLPDGLDTAVQVEYPAALCDVDSTEQSLPDALFAFDESASFSPDGLQLVGYEWSILDQPEGSFAGLSSLTGQATVLEGDAVGLYDVRLNVINELGLRSDEPCIIQVEVVDAS